MIALLDVNVLVALAWPNHVHHQAVREWFRRRRKEGWATCPTTQNGFIRVSSNSRITPEAKSPQEAALLLRTLTSTEEHVFWPEDMSLIHEKWVPLERITTYQQVTDAHLLSVALGRGGCLATFDRGIARLVPGNLNCARVLELVPFGAD